MAIKSEASTNTTIRPARAISAEGVFVVVVTALLGLQMMFFGMWGLVWPHAAAEFVKFDVSVGDGVHFVRDGGALSVGMGTALLLALIWRDPVTTVLAGSLVFNTIHVVNHVVDRDIGGLDSDPWILGGLSMLIAFALVIRWRQRQGTGHE
jgi:hypothetical protein